MQQVSERSEAAGGVRCRMVRRTLARTGPVDDDREMIQYSRTIQSRRGAHGGVRPAAAIWGRRLRQESGRVYPEPGSEKHDGLQAGERAHSESVMERSL